MQEKVQQREEELETIIQAEKSVKVCQKKQLTKMTCLLVSKGVNSKTKRAVKEL